MTKKLPIKEKLLREAKRLAKKTNSRLRELGRTYPDSTWAETTLRGKLENKRGLTKKGFAKANKKMSEAELRASIKAQKEFLKDKRSTPKGLEQVRKKLEKAMKESLKENLSDADITVSADTADNLIQLFKESSFLKLLKYMPPSEIWVIVMEAKKRGIKSEKGFIDLARTQIEFSENRGIVTALSGFYKEVYKSEFMG